MQTKKQKHLWSQRPIRQRDEKHCHHAGIFPLGSQDINNLQYMANTHS